MFDKDGTLIDLDARWGPFFATTLAQVADGDAAVEADLALALGLDGERLVPNRPLAVKTADECHDIAVETLARRGWSRGRVDEAFRSARTNVSFGDLVPLGPVADTLDRLAAAGFRLAVATSDDRANTVEELAELGIGHHFEVLVCGDDGVIKPDPQVLWSICEAWSTEPEHVLFVGDSDQDRACAEAAGCPFVTIGPNPPAIPTIEELLTHDVISRHKPPRR